MELSEKFNLEFKVKVTKTFLKTVSAYANYNDGEILFGIDDDGRVEGLDHVKNERIKIETMINETIDPKPDFRLEVKEIDGKPIIVLAIRKGRNTPYYYNGKAYKRVDTSTAPVDRFELNRLVLEGSNFDYEELQSSSQELKFSKLEYELKEKTGINGISIDILKTLNLYHKDGYFNIAGELLADNSRTRFSGIDIIRFGKDIHQILYREIVEHVSLLTQYDRAVALFEQYYQLEEIEGYTRVTRERIPKEAFREALANAIIHRVWDIHSYIQISMFDDKIIIESPGGLPPGISIDEYLYGTISVLRNPILANVFYRLDLIEKFGTGIARINREYEKSLSKPDFPISPNSIAIVLPVIASEQAGLSKEETAIYNLLKHETELTRKELDRETDFDKYKTIRILNGMIERRVIKKSGNGPGTTYRIK